MEEIKQEAEDLDLESRVREITERMSMLDSSRKASEQRAASSAIGTENPVGILSDIRESNNKLINIIRESMAMSEEREKKLEIRHKEICTILLSMRGGIPNKSEGSVVHPTLMSPLPNTPQKSHNYYGGTAITSGVHLVSCVMMHLDIILTRHPQFRKISTTDSTFMDIKEWYVICNAVINADKNSKAGLRMPKPSDEDFKSACRIVASPVEGRRPNCDASNIMSLIDQSPALMNTVEWTRSALIKCAGSLSPERQCRFKCIQYPFVDDESELNVQKSPKLSLSRKSRHRDVSDLKNTQKKEYMRLILELDFNPDEALSRVQNKA